MNLPSLVRSPINHSLVVPNVKQKKPKTVEPHLAAITSRK